MKAPIANSFDPLVARIHKLFRTELALENDFLRQENRILNHDISRIAFAQRVKTFQASFC